MPITYTLILLLCFWFSHDCFFILPIFFISFTNVFISLLSLLIRLSITSFMDSIINELFLLPGRGVESDPLLPTGRLCSFPGAPLSALYVVDQISGLLSTQRSNLLSTQLQTLSVFIFFSLSFDSLNR